MRVAILLTVVLLTSGCITAYNGTDDEDAVAHEEPPEPVVRSGRVDATHSYTAPTVYVGSTRTPLEADFEPPASTFRIDFGLKWETDANDFVLVVERPDGEEVRFTGSGDGSEVLAAIDDPPVGPYTFFAEGEGVVRPDTLEGFATFHYFVADDLEIKPWVQVQRDGDFWLATATYMAEGEVGEAAEFELDTFNGGITVGASDDDKAHVTVGPWARAPTEERARALLLSLHIDLYVAEDTIFADVTQGDLRPNDRESFGATIDGKTPVATGGSLDTTNGAIHIDGITARDLSADTTNGGISGAFEAAGDLSIDTTNGPIVLTIKPTGSGDWMMDTTNGGITLRLKEGDAIGYRLEASTTNGDIGSDMDDATLEGDENDATLKTRGFADRDIQVTGGLETTNGSVRFVGT